MPASYSFQLNLDLSTKISDPNFSVDFPAFSGILSSSNFAEYCIPSGHESILHAFDTLTNGARDFLNIDGQLKSTNNNHQFLPIKLHATLQRSLNGDNEYFQCFLTPQENDKDEHIPELINAVFQHNPQSFCYLALDGSIIRVNKVLADFLMIPQSNFTDLNFLSFVQPHEQEDAQRIFLDAANGISSTYDFSVTIADGTPKRVRINIFPRFQKGAVVGVYGIFEDVTETIETQHRWKILVEQNPLPVLIFIDRKFVFTNTAAAAFYDVEDKNELLGMSVLDFCPPEEQEHLKGREKKIMEFGKIESAESLIQTKSGKTRYIIANACKINYYGKEAIQSVIYDITEIKKQKEIIQKSLNEKETLLKEIHHRVKNNLAIISGLIELQIQTIKDQGTIDVLRDSQNRIQSIALVHQQLYQFESFDEINLAKYLRDLITGLKQTFESSKKIDFLIEADDIKISIEQAVPCSLVVNEVVINAFKHAFTGVDKPTLEISIKQKAEVVELIICDNGIGIGNKAQRELAPSLGTTLIEILTQQLEGSSNYVACKPSGTCFKLSFPV